MSAQQGYRAVIGPSGSGKTMIGLELAGLIPSSRLDCDGGMASVTAVEAAYVPNDPYLAFSGIKPTLRGELELSMQFLGVAGDDARKAAQRVSEALELVPLLDRDPFTLSGGEAMRAAIAVVTVKGPRRLVLDEIYCALAPPSVALVRRYFASLRATGCEIVELFNAPPAWLDAFESVRWIGGACPSGEAHALPRRRRRWDDLATGEQVPVLALEGLTYRYASGFQLGPIDLTVRAGEWLALVGPNGAGKTTFLKCLAGLLNGHFSSLVVGSEPMRAPAPTRTQRRNWPRTILYTFQNPDDQIYCATTRGELLETARWVSPPGYDARLGGICATLDLARDLDSAPTILPRPRRKLVSVGSSLIAATPILLLDEPSAGLDPGQRANLGEAISAFCESGGSVIMISHDDIFVDHYSDRIVAMTDGRIVSTDPARG